MLPRCCHATRRDAMSDATLLMMLLLPKLVYAAAAAMLPHALYAAAMPAAIDATPLMSLRWHADFRCRFAADATLLPPCCHATYDTFIAGDIELL